MEIQPIVDEDRQLNSLTPRLGHFEHNGEITPTTEACSKFQVLLSLAMSRVKTFPYSSRSRIIGSTASARCAGIHEAISPRTSMVTITPPSTQGSFGVA